MDEISDEISINIYEKIYKVKDKHNMIQVNKYFNNLFQDDFNKYYVKKLLNTDFNKYYVKKLLNTDYLEFYKYLNKYDYEMDYLNTLLINATEDIHTVWSQYVSGTYDLRYIFELMYKGCVLKDNIETMYQGSIIKVNITSYSDRRVNNDTRNIYKNFYKHIVQSIVYNDRHATLFNIEHSGVMLSALKQSYTYYKRGEYENKPYIKLVSS
jgi:hypothetical protein